MVVSGLHGGSVKLNTGWHRMLVGNQNMWPTIDGKSRTIVLVCYRLELSGAGR